MIEYAKLDPSFPGRIISMAEEQGRHRRDCERRALDADIAELTGTRRRKHCGMACGFVLALACIGAGIVAEYYGRTTFAITIVTTTVAMLVAAFVLGKLWSAKEQTRT